MTTDGKTERLPVAARPAPFDVQLGRGPDRRVYAVYSRCAREPADLAIPLTKARGCRLFAVDLARRREQPLDVATPEGVTSMFLPAISGRRVAYAARDSDGRIALYLGTIGSKPARRLSLPRPAGDDPHAHCPEDGATYDVSGVSWDGSGALRYLAVIGGSAEGAIRRVDLSTGATTQWAPGFEYGSREVGAYAVDGRGAGLGQIGGEIVSLPILPVPASGAP